MDIMVRPFLDNAFLQNALMAGFLVAVVCGMVGTFVVLRGLAFIGDALAHGVLPGVAVALLLGINGMIGAGLGCLVMIGGIGYVKERTNLSMDTAIGLLFVGMLALGVVIVSHSNSFSGDLVRVLFGEILGISRNDLWLQLGAALLLAVLTVVCYRPFLLLCFSPEQAQTAGFSAKKYHWIMLMMIAITVMVSFQTVGTLLVFGMLLAPAATSSLFARRIGSMMGFAILIGCLAVYGGLLLSYHFNFAAGACIVLVAVTIFMAAMLGRNTGMEFRRRRNLARGKV